MIKVPGHDGIAITKNEYKWRTGSEPSLFRFFYLTWDTVRLIRFSETPDRFVGANDDVGASDNDGSI